MNRLKFMVTVMLALLWLPVTVHCRLESIPAVAFLACSPASGSDQTPAHHDNDCETDACATVESGLYKQEDPQIPLAQPALACAEWEASAATLAEAAPCVPSLQLSPSELPRCWQFLLRAALPVRAPSLLS